MLWVRGVVLLLLVLMFTDLLLVRAWNFAPLDVATEDVSVIHISVHFMRVFISNQNHNNKTRVPTLIESVWPEQMLPSLMRPFPMRNSHFLVERYTPARSCKKLIQSYRTNIDHRGHIWILDNGSARFNCAPKLLILNLHLFNEEIDRIYLTDYKPHAFTDFVLDRSQAQLNGTRGIFSLRESDFILAYCLQQRHLQRLTIQRSHFDDRPPTRPAQISITALTDVLDHGVIFLSDAASEHLYYADLRIGQSANTLYAINLGSLMGHARSLTADPDGFLYYILNRDGAVLRWNMRKRLMAEEHDVLHLQQLRIAQIYVGRRGAVWIVNERPDDESLQQQHTFRIMAHYSAEPKLIEC